MDTITSLEDLKNIDFQELEEAPVDKSAFRNHSKCIAFTVGYLLGVREDFLATILDDEAEFQEAYDKISNNENARIIRALNNMRSNIMLRFKQVSQTIRLNSADYKPIYNIEFLKDDFDVLKKYEIDISTGRADLNEYLSKINSEINKKIDRLQPLFPYWVNFKYIRSMFIMKSNIEAERKKFQANQSCYPYKRFFNWENPEECGNVLLTDARLLDIIYRNNGDHFEDLNKVIDASDNVKYTINEFIKNGEKVQIFIDGENIDPYCFAAMIDSLKDYEIEKIDKIIVYYDAMFSSKAWEMLKHFTCGIKVEPIAVERIKEDKSLVDHKLTAGVSKACYKEGVDSIILASSDSDFWSIIEDVDAKYLVLVEREGFGKDFKEILRKHDIFYCYVDKFMTPSDNKFFRTVFCNELKKAIGNSFQMGNAQRLLEAAILQSRARVSPDESNVLFKKYISGLKLDIDEAGNFQIIIPEWQ